MPNYSRKRTNKRRSNPINLSSAYYVDMDCAKQKKKKVKDITKINNSLAFEAKKEGGRDIGKTGTQVWDLLYNADPSPEKVYLNWLIKTFNANVATAIDDIDAVKDCLQVFYDENRKQRPIGWAKQFKAKDYKTYSQFCAYLYNAGAMGDIIIAETDEVSKVIIQQQRKGNIALIYQDDNFIVIDEVTREGAETLGKMMAPAQGGSSQWCTAAGSWDTYALDGVFILWDLRVPSYTQITVKRNSPSDNGIFNEAKNEMDVEIDWRNRYGKLAEDAKEIAKESAKIVEKRLAVSSGLTPISNYLNAFATGNVKAYNVIEKYYIANRFLPIGYIDQNRDKIIKLFMSNYSEAQARKVFAELQEGIAKEVLSVECLVHNVNGLVAQGRYPETQAEADKVKGMIVVGLDMKDIPEGVHQFQTIDVILDAFLMNAYETTNALWLLVMGEDAEGGWETYVPLRNPKVNISWYDCVKFCNKMSEKMGLEPVYEIDGDEVNWIWEANGFRLPSEAEWEAAARARGDFIYAGSNNPDEVAWYSENSGGRVHKVGLKKPNKYGLYDMSGNVSEWVYDSYSNDPLDKEEQPLRTPSLAKKYANKNPRRRKKRRR